MQASHSELTALLASKAAVPTALQSAAAKTELKRRDAAPIDPSVAAAKSARKKAKRTRQKNNRAAAPAPAGSQATGPIPAAPPALLRSVPAVSGLNHQAGAPKRRIAPPVNAPNEPPRRPALVSAAAPAPALQSPPLAPREDQYASHSLSDSRSPSEVLGNSNSIGRLIDPKRAANLERSIPCKSICSLPADKRATLLLSTGICAGVRILDMAPYGPLMGERYIVELINKGYAPAQNTPSSFYAQRLFLRQFDPSLEGKEWAGVNRNRSSIYQQGQQYLTDRFASARSSSCASIAENESINMLEEVMGSEWCLQMMRKSGASPSVMGNMLQVSAKIVSAMQALDLVAAKRLKLTLLSHYHKSIIDKSRQVDKLKCQLSSNLAKIFSQMRTSAWSLDKISRCAGAADQSRFKLQIAAHDLLALHSDLTSPDRSPTALPSPTLHPRAFESSPTLASSPPAVSVSAQPEAQFPDPVPSPASVATACAPSPNTNGRAPTPNTPGPVCAHKCCRRTTGWGTCNGCSWFDDPLQPRLGSCANCKHPPADDQASNNPSSGNAEWAEQHTTQRGHARLAKARAASPQSQPGRTHPDLASTASQVESSASTALPSASTPAPPGSATAAAATLAPDTVPQGWLNPMVIKAETSKRLGGSPSASLRNTPGVSTVTPRQPTKAPAAAPALTPGPPAQPTIALLYLAKDGHWRACELLSRSSNSALVRFVRCGSRKEITQLQRLRPWDPELLDTPVTNAWDYQLLDNKAQSAGPPTACPSNKYDSSRQATERQELLEAKNRSLYGNPFGPSLIPEAPPSLVTSDPPGSMSCGWSQPSAANKQAAAPSSLTSQLLNSHFPSLPTSSSFVPQLSQEKPYSSSMTRERRRLHSDLVPPSGAPPPKKLPSSNS